MTDTKEVKEEPLEKQLWKSADKLRKNINAAEYKHVVLGLIFLKYISDSFEELHEKLKSGKGEYVGADPEDRDEYKAENVFFVPENARWTYLQANATKPTIGKMVDEAMDAVEKESPSLRGVLPKVYARQNLDPISLGGIINLIGDIALGDVKSKSADILGHVFEYFLGEFALAEGKKGGQFYTPRTVVELLVEMLEPQKGRVFDPCCGSGGMFVQSEEFVEDHQGRINDISIYGQESNLDTWRLAKMNLAIRGIDSSQVKWNNEGSFLNDAHKDLKADYIIANPPFNVSDWSGNLLRNDARWKYGIPPTGNANFAWVQHFVFHLAPEGKAGFVLANGSLSSMTAGEGEIRKKLITEDLVECIVMLPNKLFLNTGIPACLWFLNRSKNSRKNEVLFIDCSSLGQMIDNKTKKLSDEEIKLIAKTYHNWSRSPKDYNDVPGFSKSTNLKEIEDHKYILTPGRYVGQTLSNKNVLPISDEINLLNKHLKKKTEEFLKLDDEIKKSLKLFYTNLNWDGISFNSARLLENLALRLFKAWFIDFEFPINSEYANLFDCENLEKEMGYKSAGGQMISSKLGDIPLGWEVKELQEMISVKRGGSPRPIKNFIVETGGYPWVKISDATKTKTPFIVKVKEKIKKEGLSKTVFLEKGALILSNSATPGLPKFLELDACIHDGWLYFPEIKILNQNYLYLLFIHLRKEIVQKGSGSVFTNLKTDILKEQLIPVPPRNLISAFSKLVDPIFNKIRSSAVEITEFNIAKNDALSQELKT